MIIFNKVKLVNEDKNNYIIKIIRIWKEKVEIFFVNDFFNGIEK